MFTTEPGCQLTSLVTATYMSDHILGKLAPLPPTDHVRPRSPNTTTATTTPKKNRESEIIIVFSSPLQSFLRHHHWIRERSTYSPVTSAGRRHHRRRLRSRYRKRCTCSTKLVLDPRRLPVVVSLGSRCVVHPLRGARNPEGSSCGTFPGPLRARIGEDARWHGRRRRRRALYAGCNCA